ncbi:MAG TPA: hypothetical protein V6C71_12750 [Coleofasciculaceae cyanobacterium]|jgi:PIN domain nuclease of toxin-antitoxin system
MPDRWSNNYHIFIVYRLPLHHRDPFDRILIATAMPSATPIRVRREASPKDSASPKG